MPWPDRRLRVHRSDDRLSQSSGDQRIQTKLSWSLYLGVELLLEKQSVARLALVQIVENWLPS